MSELGSGNAAQRYQKLMEPGENLQNDMFYAAERKSSDRKLWEERVKASRHGLRGWETMHTEQMRSKHIATGSH